MKNLGDKIKFARKERTFTCEDLAKLANVSQAYISQIENNERTPSARTINALADALNVPKGFLMDENVRTLNEYEAAEKLKNIVGSKKYIPFFSVIDTAVNEEITPEDLADALEFLKRHKKKA